MRPIILARGTRRAVFALLALVALSGCPSGGSDDGGVDAARDTSTAMDVPSVDRGVDAPAPDQGVDAPPADRPADTTPDAAPPVDAPPPVDARADATRDATEPTDAAPDTAAPPDAAPDVVMACGTLGAECRDTSGCSPGEECYASARGGVCGVARAICGGFAGAPCPAAAPRCLMLAGTDYGACATDAERDCICARASGTIVDGCR